MVVLEVMVTRVMMKIIMNDVSNEFLFPGLFRFGNCSRIHM